VFLRADSEGGLCQGDDKIWAGELLQQGDHLEEVFHTRVLTSTYKTTSAAAIFYKSNYYLAGDLNIFLDN
jgi:hypothetical protein